MVRKNLFYDSYYMKNEIWVIGQVHSRGALQWVWEGHVTTDAEALLTLYPFLQ